MNDHYCRVCGLYLMDKPWGDDGETPTFEICPCCGVEFGNEDSTLTSIRRYRIQWLEQGTPWFDITKKPKDWKLVEQLQNISEFL